MRPWNTLRLAVMGAVLGGVLTLCANIARSFGGRISGPALLAEVLAVACALALLVALASVVRNRIAGA